MTYDLMIDGQRRSIRRRRRLGTVVATLGAAGAVAAVVRAVVMLNAVAGSAAGASVAAKPLSILAATAALGVAGIVVGLRLRRS